MTAFVSRIILFLCVVLLAFPVSVIAVAGQPTEQVELHSVLGDIQWRDSKDDVIAKLRADMLREVQQDRTNQQDRVRMHKAREAVAQRISDIESSYTQLQGERTPYDISVVAGEFIKNNGETLLHVRDPNAHRYFLFIDGRLYRLVVAYSSDYLAGIDFQDFVGGATRRYGKPAERHFAEGKDEKKIISAEWSDSRTHLEVKDQRGIHATFVMTFSDAHVQRRLAASKARQENTKEMKVPPRVESLMTGSGVDKNERIVDSIVGDVNVDLRTNSKPTSRRSATDSQEKSRQNDNSKSSNKSKDDKKTGNRDVFDDVLVY